MKKYVKLILNNKKLLSYLIILFVSVFICIPLFSKYMDISRDDGIQHICRLIGNFNTLKEGNLFPVIMSRFCNGFGYSWNIFYSPLTAFLPLVFKIFSASFVTCLKLFMFFTMLLSGIFMYKLVYKISKSHKAGVISAVIYMCTPYHLTDLYNRIAIAELASFVFLPIVFIGMYDLFNKNTKQTYFIAIGAIGLILSHNVMAVYTAIFCFIYLASNYKKLNNKNIIKAILINVGIILLCTSFYWIPLLEHYFATSYEVFLPERMFKNNTLIGSKLSLIDFFITKPYDMNFHIGIPILFGLILAFLYRKKIKPRYKKTITIFLVFGLISVIMSSKLFPFEYLPSSLKMIQFAWRMMEFASFFLSIVCGITITMFINGNNKKEASITILLIIYIAISIITSMKSVDVPFNEENYLNPQPITGSTGRIHAGCASFEYLPQKALRNRAYIETRKNNVIVLEGNTNIEEERKKNTNLTFKIEQAEENTKLELPYIFYLGYSAKLEKQDGTTEYLKIEESDNGFCMITVQDVSEGKISVSYTGTTLMKVAYALTLLGIMGLFYFYCKKSHKQKVY